MRTGRPLASLSVSEQDRLQLVGWTKRPKTAQALAACGVSLDARRREGMALVVMNG